MSWLDISELARSAWTVWLALLFAAAVIYALRPRSKRHFEDCARIPFRAEEEERHES